MNADSVSLRLTVLGASGGCGQWLVRLAAARGHAVTAVARAGSAVPPIDGVRVLRGDVLDPCTLDEAVQGADVVLSALGLRRANPWPWSRLLSPPDFTFNVLARLLPVMAHRSVRRLLVISAGGVGGSRAQLSGVVRRMVDAGNVAVAYRDLARMEQLLATSALDWVAVRPVTLRGGQPTGTATIGGASADSRRANGAREVQHYGLGSFVRRADVAAWMLAVAEGRIVPSSRMVLLGG